VAVQDVIGVTVTHDETNAPGGDDEGLDTVESSVAVPEPIAAPADLAEVVEEAEAAADLESDTAADGEFDGDDGDDEDEPFVVSPYDQPGRWYVVHTYAGYENKVKSNLHSRAVSMSMEDRIYEVVIPMEDVIEFKNGKKVVVQKKVFPGYLLCRCELDDDSWSVIRNTPGVTGFVGPGTKPTPLSRREVEGILQVKVEGAHQAEPAPARARGGRDGAGQRRAVRRLLGPDRRNQRGPAQAQGARQHLRPGDPGRARIQPGRKAVTRRIQVRSRT
jgi:transcription antitermination factor NusG